MDRTEGSQLRIGPRPTRQELAEPDTRQAPFRRAIGVAIVVVVVLVEVTLLAAWFELTNSVDALERADSLSLAFTDTHREFHELEDLAATEQSFDTEQVETRLGLLGRQLTIAASRLDNPETTPQLAGDIRTLLDAYDDLLELYETNPSDTATAEALADRGTQAAQNAVNRTDTITRNAYVEDALRAERTGTVVAGVAMIVLVAGAVMLWAVLLRYQRSFDEAWNLAERRRDALQATNEQLAALAETRERFVSVLSHELRSPLAVIGAVGETLHLHGDELDPDTRDGILQSLRRQVTRQQRMIDDLLLVAQHANSQPDPTPTDVDLEALLALVRRDERIEGLEAVYEVERGTVARADEHHLEQVVHNLVRNAEKYGGDLIRIAARTEGDEVVITVSDDGDGVPHEQQQTLFEPFTTGPDDTHGGIGLGLSITRQLVEANGGSITYRDGPDGGAVFEVRIPRATTTVAG